MSEIYKWSGKASNGDVVKGEITAASEQEVKSYLRKQRIIPKSVSKKPKALFSSMGGGSVKDKDLVIFTRQFSTMIGAGLPLVQTLEILSNQTENKFFAKCIGEIKSDVEGGSTFADALKKHPKIFSELYTNMVAAGYLYRESPEPEEEGKGGDGVSIGHYDGCHWGYYYNHGICCSYLWIDVRDTGWSTSPSYSNYYRFK